jgi:hypothetical protein
VTATPGPVTPAQTDIGVTSDITDTAFGDLSTISSFVHSFGKY